MENLGPVHLYMEMKDPTLSAGGNPLVYGHPTYYVNVIKLKWEIILTGGFTPNLSGFSHLPGIPHLPRPRGFRSMGSIVLWRSRCRRHCGFVRSLLFSAQRIYQSMIISIFTYCDYNSLGWLESRKSMIRSIEKRSLEIISPKCSQRNCDLRFSIIDDGLQTERAVLYLTAS